MTAAHAQSGDRWEHGSDLQLPPAQRSHGSAAASSYWAGATYWHSGRDALRALAAAAPARFARVFFPSFYCQDIAVALRADGHDVHAYPDAPGSGAIDVAQIPLRAGDALVVSNTLGLRARSPLAGMVPAGVTTVEDHTHDPFSPWARSTTADLAFASLRKWLPLPDGAVAWSGTGHSVPAAPALDGVHADVTLKRLSGMLLKSRYLAGESIEKAVYRELLVDGERRIGHGVPGSMSPVARALLDALPIAEARDARRANHARATGALASISAIRLLLPGSGAEDVVPFAATIVLPSARHREELRAALVAERIYGAVLWPIDATLLPGVPAEHADLASRILSLHCDARYDAADMDRVVVTVRRVLEAAR